MISFNVISLSLGSLVILDVARGYLWLFTLYIGGGRVVRRCWVNFQCWGVLQVDYSRARAYCACSGCGWGFFLDIFTLIYPFSSLSRSLWETARYRLKYCLKGQLNPKQSTITLYINIKIGKNSC